MGKQSVSVQTISNLQVTGSNPVGRARNSTVRQGGLFFFKLNISDYGFCIGCLFLRIKKYHFVALFWVMVPVIVV